MIADLLIVLAWAAVVLTYAWWDRKRQAPDEPVTWENYGVPDTTTKEQGQ